MRTPRRYVFTKSGSVDARVPGAWPTRYHGQPLIAVRRVDIGKEMLVLCAALVPLATWTRRNGVT